MPWRKIDFVVPDAKVLGQASQPLDRRLDRTQLSIDDVAERNPHSRGELVL